MKKTYRKSLALLKNTLLQGFIMTKAKTETKAPAKAPAKAASSSLAEKAKAVADLDRQNRVVDGNNINFISVCQKQAQALDEDNKLYIKGLKRGDFYIQKSKTRLGAKLKVVPLAFLKIYNEFEGSGREAQFRGIWPSYQAEKMPLKMNHYFNREAPNGNELRPVNWVVVYLPDYPEIENAVVAFKSTASKVAREWDKDIESYSEASCQNIYELGVKSVSNDKGSWYEITYDHQGLVYEVTAKGVTVHEDYAETVIDLSAEVNSGYANGTLVPKKVLQIEDKSDDDEDDDVVF